MKRMKRREYWTWGCDVDDCPDLLSINPFYTAKRDALADQKLHQARSGHTCSGTPPVWKCTPINDEMCECCGEPGRIRRVCTECCE